jgi:3',5'-cyclic-nucleotide phosphodiesterase
MTPISPATNASSFLAVDSGDEKRITDESAPPSEIGAPDDISTRPSTSYASVGGDQESSYSRGPGSIMDVSHSRSEGDNGHAKEYNPAANGTRSPTQSTTTGESVKNESLQGDDSRNGGLRRIPKRRSRLRLAIWKRRNHHQQEVHGES